MTNLRSCLVAGGSALVLALSLAGCTSSNSTSTDSSDGTVTATQQVSHDANFNPEDINPGWLDDEDNPGGTSDLWWPSGDQTASESIYFTNASNDAGMTVTTVYSEDQHEDSVWDLEIVDNHLKTKAGAEGEERSVDITFQDNFTCYDAVTDTTYIRGDRSQADYQKVVAGLTFVRDENDPEKEMLAFADDDTVVKYVDDSAIDGTWAVVTPNVVECHFASDNSEWDAEYRFILDDAGNAIELDDASPSGNLVVFAG